MSWHGPSKRRMSPISEVKVTATIRSTSRRLERPDNRRERSFGTILLGRRFEPFYPLLRGSNGLDHLLQSDSEVMISLAHWASQCGSGCRFPTISGGCCPEITAHGIRLRPLQATGFRQLGKRSYAGGERDAAACCLILVELTGASGRRLQPCGPPSARCCIRRHFGSATVRPKCLACLDGIS